MDISTIEMDVDKAREIYDTYRSHLAGHEKTEEDRGVLLGYKALAKGKSLINLHETMLAAGLDSMRRPRMAIARAHWEYCHFGYTWRRNGREFAQQSYHIGRHGNPGKTRIVIPARALPQSVTRDDCRAVVPYIPPNLRPKAKLENYHILWEAEWQSTPTDPLLLQQLTDSIFIVLAVWDLTNLERGVLSGRLFRTTV